MSLRAWLKKGQIFDQYIFEEFESQGFNDMPTDLGFVTSKEWKLIQSRIMSEKRKDIKDANTLKRLQQKLDKIGKVIKKENKKQKNNKNQNNKSDDCTNILIKKKAKKKSKKVKKTTSNNKKKETKIEKTLESDYRTKKLWNPLLSFVVIECWIKKYKMDKKFDRNLRVLIIQFYPLFGVGKDGDLVVNGKKVLESGVVHDFNSITLLKNSKLTVGGGGRLYFSVLDTITMNEGSCITVAGKGSSGNEPKGNTGDSTCRGGAYGRVGICKDIVNITDNKDLILGVGGEGGSDWVTFKPIRGGSGGGILKIECNKLIMKKNCILDASGSKSDYGGGSGGIIWLRCIQFINKGKKTAQIVCKGGSNGDHGRVRIDVINQKQKAKIKKIVKCKYLHFGG